MPELRWASGVMPHRNRATIRRASLGAGLFLLLAGAAWAWRQPGAGVDWVGVRFLGYAEGAVSDAAAEGKFGLTNRSRFPVSCWVRIEVRDTDGWPVPLDGYRGTDGDVVSLAPRQVANVRRAIPRLGEGWRVEVEVSRPIKLAERLRTRASMQCYQWGWNRLGERVAPALTWQTVRGPEQPRPQ